MTNKGMTKSIVGRKLITDIKEDTVLTLKTII